MVRLPFILLFASLVSWGYAQTGPATTIEGTVDVLVLDHLQVKASDGATKVVVLPPGVIVTRRVLVDWTDIHSGDWVGVDSKPGSDGQQESVAINVFSPGIIAKVRKGQFTMASGDLMTNAPVEKVDKGTSGQSLTLKNEGAMVSIRIGSQTIVHRLLDAATMDIKPRGKVQIRGNLNDDGTIKAGIISLLES